MTKKNNKTRQDAWQLLTEYTTNPNLIKHSLAVEEAMRYYARYFNEDVEKWGIVGLLHDFDYERYPSLDDHPYKGQAILEAEGFSDEIRQAVMAHAPHTGTERKTLMEKSIFAVDELTGFIVAVALVKPSKKLAEVDVKSVKKKIKQLSFAKAVNREDIHTGAKELNMEIDEHINHVLSAMQKISDKLKL